MSLNNWDPLEGELPSELLSATVKRQIKNILKSYTGWFDPLSELIQNALDAVEARRRTGDKFDPQLWIHIDLKENLISVTDNGIGFALDQFRSFLAPNVSFKGQDNRGSKGVGATYLGYGFNFLQIATKTPDFRFIGSIKKGREWVEDEKGVETRPKILEENSAQHDAFEKIDRGTSFTLALVGNFVRPRRLNWVNATKASQWDPILRVKTPLGGLYPAGKVQVSRCYLRVTDEAGEITEEIIDRTEYLYPHTVIGTSVELDEIRRFQRELIEKGKDPTKLPERFFRLNGLFNRWPCESFSEKGGEFFDKLSGDQRELARRYTMSVYAFFGYSTDIWDYFNDEQLKIRKGERVLRGGIQFATNSMPQGDLIQIPLNRNIGYQNVAHVVIHFNGAEPDLGRKGFQPELEDLGKEVAVLLVNAMLGWRKHLRRDTGAPPDITEKKNIHDWITQQEAHEKAQPLIIKRTDLFLPTREPSLTSVPLNEQDVIALFNQLLAGGVIRGIKLMAASTHNQYDGICRFVLSKPLENHVYSKSDNPLGIDETAARQEFVSAPGILEYKYSFDALVEEFEKEEKVERDIGLVVVWTMGTRWSGRYEITPLLHFSSIHHRYFHGATHLMRSSNTGDRVFPVVVLSELIDFINDPDAVQKIQEEKYLAS